MSAAAGSIHGRPLNKDEGPNWSEPAETEARASLRRRPAGSRQIPNPRGAVMASSHVRPYHRDGAANHNIMPR